MLSLSLNAHETANHFRSHSHKRRSFGTDGYFRDRTNRDARADAVAGGEHSGRPAADGDGDAAAIDTCADGHGLSIAKRLTGRHSAADDEHRRAVAKHHPFADWHAGPNHQYSDAIAVTKLTTPNA